MSLLIVGLSHKSATVEIRERLAFNSRQLGEALTSFRMHHPSTEIVILSTCNRVELVVSTPDLPDGGEEKEVSAETLISFLAAFHRVKAEEFSEHLYTLHEADAVRHLFMVITGLDSMVVGESQILGQAKEGYMAALQAESSGRMLNSLFQTAFNAVKEIRTKSEYLEGQVSVSSVAAEFAQKIFQDISGKVVMIVGAGETSELTLKSMVNRGASSVIVSNRHRERAEKLAEQYDGKAIGFDDLADHLAQADIVISSTAAPVCVIHYDQVAKAIRARRNKPIFMIDIAVPRDIDPRVNDIDNVYLYNIDDLQTVVSRNIDRREGELEACVAEIDAKVDRFMQSLRVLQVEPTVADLKDYLHSVGESELERLLPKLSNPSEADREAIKYAIQRVINKVLHRPLGVLKEEAHTGNGYKYVEIARRLFGIDDEKEREE